LVDISPSTDILNEVLSFEVDHQIVAVLEKKGRRYNVLREGDGIEMLPITRV
jgi:hypothetical protein